MGFVIFWENYMAWSQAVVVAPLIARSKRRWLKVAWHLVLLSSLVVFTVQSFYQVKDYLAFKTTTTVRLEHQTQAPFPAVTFCNLNPFKKSMVHHSQELTNLLTAYSYVTQVKHAEMQSRVTAAVKATTSPTASHKRRKRQDPGRRDEECEEIVSVAIEPSSSQQHTDWMCPNGAVGEGIGACNVNITIPAADVYTWKNRTATVFYSCFHNLCTNGKCKTNRYGDELTTEFKDCDNVTQVGSYKYTYTCTWVYANEDDDDLNCTQIIECFPPTTTESPSSSAVPQTPMTPSTSKPDTTTAQLTSTTELSTTMSGASATTTVAGTSTIEPTTTTTEPITTTRVPLKNSMETSTMIVQTSTDATSTTSTSTTTTREVTITTTGETSTSTQTSETAAATTQLETMTTSTGATTTSQTTTAVENASTEQTYITSVNTTFASTSSSTPTSTTEPDTTKTSPETTSTTSQTPPDASLRPTMASTAGSSTDAVRTTLETASTQHATSNVLVESTTPIHGSSSVSRTSTDNTISTTLGFPMTSLSVTSLSGSSAFSKTLATSTPLTSTTTDTASSKHVGQGHDSFRTRANGRLEYSACNDDDDDTGKSSYIDSVKNYYAYCKTKQFHSKPTCDANDGSVDRKQ